MSYETVFNGEIIRQAHLDGVSEEIIAALAGDMDAVILVPRCLRLYSVKKTGKGKVSLDYTDRATAADFAEESVRRIRQHNLHTNDCFMVCKI